VVSADGKRKKLPPQAVKITVMKPDDNTLHLEMSEATVPVQLSI
jgi:hypothetical protein